MTEIFNVVSSDENHGSADVLFARLKAKAWKQGIPLMGLFELTPQCTLNCEMCYVHLSKEQMSHPELPVADWLLIMQQACDAGMMFATLSGGECLLYPGFRQLYHSLSERGVLVTILTNGTLLNDKLVSWLSERKPKRIQISVYGSSPEAYARVTGSATAFHRVERAIDLLHQACIPFDLAITVSRNLVDNFENLLNYCLEKEPRQCIVNPCPFDSRPETGRDSNAYFPTLEQQVEIFRVQKRVRSKKAIQKNEAIENHIKEKTKTNPALLDKGIPCTAGRNSFSITWEGKMLPCAVFAYSETDPLQDGFTKAWDVLHRQCLTYKNPPECLKCSYYNACRYCPAGHYLKMGEGKANPSVCQEAQRMVAEKIRFL